MSWCDWLILNFSSSSSICFCNFFSSSKCITPITCLINDSIYLTGPTPIHGTIPWHQVLTLWNLFSKSKSMLYYHPFISCSIKNSCKDLVLRCKLIYEWVLKDLSRLIQSNVWEHSRFNTYLDYLTIHIRFFATYTYLVIQWRIQLKSVMLYSHDLNHRHVTALKVITLN